jgi:hypothetical protein
MIKDLITLIKAEQAAISQALSFGNCVNFESYNRLVGQNLGLEKSLELINLLLSEQNKEL